VKAADSGRGGRDRHRSRGGPEGLAYFGSTGFVDEDQVVAYDLAHAAPAVETARMLLGHGTRGQ
jgi:hypothetical protein